MLRSCAFRNFPYSFSLPFLCVFEVTRTPLRKVTETKNPAEKICSVSGVLVNSSGVLPHIQVQNLSIALVLPKASSAQISC